MANYTSYQKVTTDLILELELPTNWAEVQKALKGMEQELRSRGRGLEVEYDDIVLVESDGETLQFVAHLGTVRMG